MTAIDFIMNVIRKGLEHMDIESNASKFIKKKSFFLERYYHNQTFDWSFHNQTIESDY